VPFSSRTMCSVLKAILPRVQWPLGYALPRPGPVLDLPALMDRFHTPLSTCLVTGLLTGFAAPLVRG
jgi:hypothetical protein